MNKKERFQEFIDRLRLEEAASSSESAFILLGNTLNQVEDEFSSIPFAPTLWMSDGRMYQPQPDSKRSTENTDIDRYRSKQHNTYIGSNGAIKIIDIRSKQVVIDKPGKDKRKIGDL